MSTRGGLSALLTAYAAEGRRRDYRRGCGGRSLTLIAQAARAGCNRRPLLVSATGLANALPVELLCKTGSGC